MLKKRLCLFTAAVFCLLFRVSFAQTADSVYINPVTGKVEKDAYFKGGEKAWIRFISNNLKIKKIYKTAPPGTYTAVVQFVIDYDGSIGELEPLTDIGYGIEEEVMRVIKLSPPWIPAFQDDKKVKAYRRQPVTLTVYEKKSKVKSRQ